MRRIARSFVTLLVAALMANIGDLASNTTVGAADLTSGVLLSGPRQRFIWGGTQVSTTASSGVHYMLSFGAAITAVTANPTATLGPPASARALFHNADLLITGRTLKMFARYGVSVAGTSSTVNVTFQIETYTIASGAGVGTVVAASQVAINTPAANATTEASVADFAIPSDGVLALTATPSGIPNVNLSCVGEIFTRNV